MGQLKRQPDGDPTDLTETVTVIGRATSCEFSISDVADLSREHCGIHKYQDGSYTLEDYSSRNGTFLNGEQIFEESPLSHCDTVRLGKYVELIFTNPPRRSNRPDPISAASQVLLRAAPISYLGVKTLALGETNVAALAPVAAPEPDLPPVAAPEPDLPAVAAPEPDLPQESVGMLEQFRHAVKDRH